MGSAWDERREKGFILDCVAVSSVARVYEYTRPRLWSVLPPYNARNDPHAVRYTSVPAVQKILKKTENREQSCIAVEKSLDLRNATGAGHSREQVSNHSGLVRDVKPPIGYNGRYGYRRNTPSLRDKPSSFGELKTLPLY